MRLDGLLEEAGVVGEVPPVDVSGLDYDSRRVAPGHVFFAFPGEQVDGHRFVNSVRAAGAAAVVSERPAPPDDAGVWVTVEHGRRALAAAALAFYDHPDRRLKLIGVTGTNGKTTTVALIDHILRTAGFTTAKLGTIEHRVGERAVEAVNTTPESLDLVRYFAELEGIGGTHVALEASSHALELGRIHGMAFDTAVFTNLSQDHLDLHGDMQSYARAKRRLFEGAGGPPPRAAVINVDDPVGREFLDVGGFEATTFGRARDADVRATSVQADLGGLRVSMTTPVGSLEIRSELAALYNVENILAAVATGLAQGLDLEAVRLGVESCTAVPGRFETIREGQDFLVVVDYAHTDDALRNLIEAARAIAGGGRILTLFGCGGDRDRDKRPRMGQVAGELSNRVFLTSDNPRHEDPLRILADAEVGLQRVDADYVRVPDRRNAMREALLAARPGDVVLIAGKGHEPYQMIGSEKLKFDDRETARELLHELGRSRS